MAQSNESNLLGIPSSWPNHTMKPPHSWTQCSHHFQLAIIAKENLDIDSFDGPEVPETQKPILEQAPGSELDTERVSRKARNENALKLCKAAQEKRINEIKKTFNCMRPSEADKKLRFILFLAIGSEGESAQKNPRVKVYQYKLPSSKIFYTLSLNNLLRQLSRGINCSTANKKVGSHLNNFGAL